MTKRLALLGLIGGAILTVSGSALAAPGFAPAGTDGRWTGSSGAVRLDTHRRHRSVRQRHSRRMHVVRHRDGNVRSKSGATARVASKYAASFQCVVDWLDGQGYRIEAMGGIARRSYRRSLHPMGAALDIDQSSRNRLMHGKRFPAGVNAAAKGCGLMHGDREVWRSNPDYGHFQVASVSSTHIAHRHRRSPNIAYAAEPAGVTYDRASLQSYATYQYQQRRPRYARYAASPAVLRRSRW